MNIQLFKRLLLIPLLLVAFESNSQFQIGLNGNFLYPIGSIANYYRSGIGAGVTGKYVVDNSFAFGGFANANFLGLPGGAILGNLNALYNVGGLFEYYFSQEPSSAYFGLDVGYYSLNISYSSFGAQYSGTTNSNYNSAGIAPNLGYKIKIGERSFLNLNAKYHYIFSALSNYGGSTQFFQFTAGYIFSLGR